ncbi:protein artichoke-like [Tribolium madens]|uniref:protein artichoke-like n=1 Tax=Tribolium madens TaxID=41895 RepID=UPI001CF7434C|nr:protein artichoke-like [Tribolium madens]
MKFCFSTLFSLIFFTKETLQSCVLINTAIPIRTWQYRMHTIKSDNSIQCLNETISSNFGAKVKPLADKWLPKWLQISDTKSPAIPAGAFSFLSTLPDLRINNASVQIIQPGAFNGLTHLLKLSLKYNRITNVKENYFANLSMLEDLDLSFNNIASVNSKSFVGLKRLRVLSLQNNILTELPPDLFKDQIESLYLLDLSFNKLVTINSELVSNIKTLDSIYLNNNNLKSLNGYVFNNTKGLKNIYISNNNLQALNNLTLPSTITLLNASFNLIKSMSFLDHAVIDLLDMSSNGITSLKNLVFENATIKQLNLDQNYLGIHRGDNQSDFFRSLLAIETLSLSNNNLQQLNRNVFTHNKVLNKLNLTGNYLDNGDFLNVLTKLEYLNLSFNNFDSNINLTVLSNLKELDISFNNLHQIPFNFLAGLKFLQNLNLSNNKIAKVTLGCFRDLQRLRIIDLSNNQISSLDVGVFVGLFGLTELNLSNNELMQLNGEVFHNMRFLRVLNLRKTKINYTIVENILSQSLSLRNLDLAENNWSCSLLTKLINKHRMLKLTDAGDYNITNIDGVACNNEDEDLTDLVNLETRNFTTFNVKLSTMNTLLIFILIVLLTQLAITALICKKNKIKIGKRQKSEQEIQLVSDC